MLIDGKPSLQIPINLGAEVYLIKRHGNFGTVELERFLSNDSKKSWEFLNRCLLETVGIEKKLISRKIMVNG